jgi:hypothetical protein
MQTLGEQKMGEQNWGRQKMQHAFRAGLMVIVFAVLSSPAVHAQAPRISDSNRNTWYMFFGDHRLTDKWGVHTEFQFRRQNTIKDPQQTMVRPAVNYYLRDGVLLTMGYGFFETYPYGGFPFPREFPEHRIFEQVQINNSIGRVALINRYRLEQRWAKFPSGTDYLFLNRMRYMLRANVPLVGTTIDAHEPFVSFYDELFIGFGGNVPNIFDQNRAFASIGYKFNKQGSIEVGYMNQTLQQRNQRVYEHNHTLQIILTYNMDFRKHRKP